MVTKQGNYCTCNLHLLVTAFSDWHWLWLSSHQFCQHAIQLPCSFYTNFYGMWVHEHAYWGGWDWVQWLGLLLTVIDVSTTCVVLIFRDKVNNCELWILSVDGMELWSTDPIGQLSRLSDITGWCAFAQLTSNCVRLHNLKKIA